MFIDPDFKKLTKINELFAYSALEAFYIYKRNLIHLQDPNFTCSNKHQK